MIEFAPDSAEVQAGGRVKGVARWLPKGETRIKRLVVTVGWRTEGRGDVDSKELFRGERPGQTVPAGGFVELAFDAAIPRGGPISYDGKLIRVIWEVTLVADIPWARDAKENAVFRVVPSSPTQ